MALSRGPGSARAVLLGRLSPHARQVGQGSAGAVSQLRTRGPCPGGKQRPAAERQGQRQAPATPPAAGQSLGTAASRCSRPHRASSPASPFPLCPAEGPGGPSSPGNLPLVILGRRLPLLFCPVAVTPIDNDDLFPSGSPWGRASTTAGPE